MLPQKNFKDYSARLLKAEQSIVLVKKEALIRIALVFPNSYQVGMSNLGFQEVFRQFNRHPQITCERSFDYPPPLHQSALTLETGHPLRECDIIAFSVAFELDYPNIVKILMNAQLPPLASARNDWHPLVIAGGVVTMLNPTPLAPFIDVFLFGEAQPLIEAFIKIILANKADGLKSSRCLEQLAQHPSCWVPRLEVETEIQKQIQRDRRDQPIQSSVISPWHHFKNMHLIEVGRACGRGCYFCAASYIYRPTQFFPTEKIKELAQNNPFQTRRIGLIGSALSDFPQLTELCRRLVESNFQLGLSSFRMDKITPEFMAILENAGIRSLSLAPEAGTERLRRIIHKQLTDEQIITALETLKHASITHLKFYFIIGLPFETPADIEGIIVLVQKAINILTNRFQIAVSINAFIPKPMTPFQWCPMATEKDLKHIRQYITHALRRFKNVTVMRKSIREELLQTLFSQGDQRVGHLLLRQVEKGANWKSLFNQNREMVVSFVWREKDMNTTLPWDFLKYPVPKQRLRKLWEKIRTDFLTD